MKNPVFSLSIVFFFLFVSGFAILNWLDSIPANAQGVADPAPVMSPEFDALEWTPINPYRGFSMPYAFTAQACRQLLTEITESHTSCVNIHTGHTLPK